MATVQTATPQATPVQSPAEFLLSMMTAVRQVTGGRPAGTWAKVDKVREKLGTTNRDAVDAAIRLAVARNWLRSDGDPPASISLTVDGVKKVEAARTPAPPAATPPG